MEDNSTRKRASRPKVKTGCLTCKSRRVKCDELKPQCRNCIRAGKQCSYPRKTSDIFILHHLAPKPTSQVPSIPKTPSSNLFLSGQELHYFNIFRERTSITIAGYFSPNLWTRTILQSCEVHPAIRACVIAIGALDETLHSAVVPQTSDRTPSVTKTGISRSVHHEFALRQYSRAIKQLRGFLNTKSPDPRTAIITCLLTVVFESLHGDMQSAVAQLRSGLRLIKTFMPAGLTKMKARIDDSGEINEVLQFFDRMDNDCIVTHDFEPIDLMSDAEPRTPDDSIAQMPAAFLELQEAKAYFEFLSKEFLHWIAFQIGWGSRQKNEAMVRSKNSEMNMLLVQQRSVFLKGFALWHQSFEPLLAASLERDTRTQACALALELRFQSLDVSLSVNHFLGEMGYDQITQRFRDLIDLSQRLLAYEMKSTTATYAVEGAIIPSVYIVALKCRDRSVRKQAIAILESRPRREGLYDSHLQAKIARLQMEIEEDGVPEQEVVPEEKRIRAIKTTSNMMTREGQMKYLKMDPSTRGFVYESVRFRW